MSAMLDIVRSALTDPATIDVWPVDAGELVEGGDRDVVDILRHLRGNGGVSLIALCSELETRRLYADAQALLQLKEVSKDLSKSGVKDAWRSLRAALPAPELKPVRVVASDREDIKTAARLVEWAAGKFIAVHGQYYAWDGRRWARDEGSRIYELAAQVAKSFFRDAQEAGSQEAQREALKHAISAQRAGRLESAVTMAARALPDLKVDPKRLDQDPWLLNVQNGTVDLRTGELRPHAQSDLLTKLAPVDFDPTAEAPRWHRFLAEVLPSEEVRAYTQRAMGSSLTGIVRDHCFFLAVGAGRNGKGVLLRTMQHILGDYAVTAPMDMFVAKAGAEHPAELAVLDGMRFVFASELPTKGRWNESRLKQLSGGDPIVARGMRENYRLIPATWKLWMATNARPRAAAQVDALWERLKEIRFPVQFRDEDDPDPTRVRWPVKDRLIEEALATELPGILRWAVEGCLRWLEVGLGEPPEVRSAVAEYRAGEDHLAPFLEEHPVTQPVKLRDLFERWLAYAKGVNENGGQARDLASALRSKGYEVRKGTGNVTTVYPLQLVVNLPGITQNGELPSYQANRDSLVFPHTRPFHRPSIGNPLTDGNWVTRDPIGTNLPRKYGAAEDEVETGPDEPEDGEAT